jgi:tetratricopeptide (TPR) repeat protein
MELTIKSKAARLVLVALEVAAFLLVTFWVGKTYLADVVSRRLNAESLSLAARLDPGDSDYHLKLGRLYQYSLTDINTSAALEELKRAAELSPYDAQAWLDLGAAQELQGQIDQAEFSLRRADDLAPNLPHFQWAIGNFFLLRGDVDEALRHFKVVLAGEQQYDQAIFSTAWKAVGDGDKILAALVPDEINTQIRYLDYLLGQHKLAEADKVWLRIDANPSPFNPLRAGAYLNALLISRQPDKAYQVWTDLQRRKLISEQAEPGNLLSNGDFEGEVSNLGFGWWIDRVPGVYVGLDSTVFHSGGRSLVISFPGDSNPYYRGVWHFVKVTPGTTYRAEAYLKTDGITTDSGPRLEVADLYNPAALNVYSDQLTGTNAAWTLVRVDFTPREKTHYVTVSIARLPSEKLDNKIAGRVWVDDVKVSPVGAGSTEALQP